LAQAAPDASATYRSDLGSGSPALDIYNFRGAQNAPVLIYVHGGGWQIGDKTAVHKKPKHFNDAGFIFVSVNYRLFPKVSVGQQLEDIDAALNWVSANIAKFGGDAGNLHLMGHSAGAHLVTMTATRPLKAAASLLADGALRSVISNDTRAYNIPAIAAQSRSPGLPKLYKDVFGENPTTWKDLSPIYQVADHQPLPDFLILHSGQGDDAERHGFAVDFAKAIKAQGGHADVVDGHRYSHAQINKTLGTNNDITQAVDSFLKTQSR